MTKVQLDIIIANGYCCSSTKAVEVSKLLSTGNLCAKSELYNLKILNDSLNTLKCHSFETDAVNCLTSDDFNSIVSKVMRLCDICECQLK